MNVGPMAIGNDIDSRNRPSPFQECLEGLVGRKVTPAEMEEARRRIGELAQVLGEISARVSRGLNPALGRPKKRVSTGQTCCKMMKGRQHL